MAVSRAKNNFLNNISSIFTNLENVNLPISIFKVPNALLSSKPEAYIPHLVGLGPYHHVRPELQQMQMCKLNEAKRIHEGFNCIGFENLVQLLYNLVGPSIRACYSMYLDMDDDVLACVMAIDGLFLFELLCCYGISRDELVKSAPLRGLVDFGGRSLAHDMTSLRESMMLENQIPIIVLKILLVIECSHISALPQNNGDAQTKASEIVKKLFPQMLLCYCKAVSPLGLVENYPQCKALKHAHLLDLLYSLIVLEYAPGLEPGEEEREERFLETLSKEVSSLHSVSVETPKPLSIKPLSQSNILARAIEIAGDMVVPPEVSRPVALVSGLVELPWTELWAIISSPAADSMAEEEILIPRAAQLHKAGVKFCRNDHIRAIKFDSKIVSFHLPLIKLNANSEVVIRNLVAYEAMIKPEFEPLIFTRYAEIMSGIIRNVEDVKVLKEQGILEFESIRDSEVVEMFKGMRKAIRQTNAEYLDRAIEEVNKYYNSLWAVSARKAAKKWRRNAWNFCRVFAILVIFLLLVLHTFCTVYGCSRVIFKNSNAVGNLQAYFHN